MPICPHCIMVAIMFLIGLPGIGYLLRLGVRYLGLGFGSKCKDGCDLTSAAMCECCERELAEFGSFLCTSCLSEMAVEYDGRPALDNVNDC